MPSTSGAAVMKGVKLRVRHAASRVGYFRRLSPEDRTQVEVVDHGISAVGSDAQNLSTNTYHNEVYDSYLPKYSEDFLSDTQVNIGSSYEKVFRTNTKPMPLTKDVKEYFRSKDGVLRQWNDNNSGLTQSNILNGNSERQNNSWLSYMYSPNILTERPDLFRNLTDLELSIDVNGEELAVDNATTTGLQNQATNNSMEHIVHIYKIVVPILLTACCLSFIFNLTMVCSVRCLRRKISPTICLSLSLAMANAYASLVLGVGLVVNSLLPIVFNYQLGPKSYCFILSLEAFRLGGLVVSVLHLLALAVNHYIGILRPLHYAHIVTRESTVVGIVSMWILPVVFFLVYFASITDDGFQSLNCSSYDFLLHSPFRITTSVMFFFPLALMIIMYSHMFIVVRQHQNGLLQCPSSRMLHKNVKAIITTLLILGTYILGWMPAVMFFVLTCLDCLVPFKDIPLDVRVPVGIFINSMIVAKSFMDPVIYVVRMPEIKSALKTILFTRCGLYTGYPTPSHSRTDTRRLTLLSSRRKSKLNANLNGDHCSPNNKQVSPNGKHCSLLAKDGARCCRDGFVSETVML